jgi:crotonobetainyl-CoA:carnitine CoA-transferase CaiB-like acyl-CoA transferase
MLNHLRALDLTDDRGFLCGKILADLGVNVIKIEKPGGDPSRYTGSFWGGVPDPEKNINWFAYNSNKKGISLDIEKTRGQEIFKAFVKTADFVLESFPPGYLDGLGLDYSYFQKAHQKLIWASITPYGLEGPYRDFKDSDIVVMGLSGTLYQTGETDGPPVHISLPQACLHASADAAVGCMVAYYQREKTGFGQRVDVSMQQSAAWFQANAIPSYELNGTILKRAGAFRTGMSTQVAQRQVWRCKDGYVFFNIIGGRTGAKTLSALVDWMDEEKLATEFLLKMDWDTFDMFTVDQDVMDKGVSIGPLSSMQDLLDNECLKSRHYWTQIEHPELGTGITYPKEYIRSTLMDFSTRSRAPLIGEHNAEVFGEMGISGKDLKALKTDGII